MSGYQSDINLDNLRFVGDFPIEHSIGGYGQTSGVNDAYSVQLQPAISQYRVGMPLQIQFHHSNTGAATLNVNDRGAIPLVKIAGDTLTPLQANDLNTVSMYMLLYDGTHFQVVSGLSLPSPAASEATPGTASIATNAEAHAGINNTKIITALKLRNVLNSLITSETDVGMSEVATQIETNEGMDDVRMVTPLKLRTLLDIRDAHEGQTGLAELATQVEVDDGMDDSRIVTPLKLAVKLASELTAKEDTLGNPVFDGWVLQSTVAGIRSWRPTNRRLFTNYGTHSGSLGTDENDLGAAYNMPSGTLSGNESLEINISGTIQGGAGNKTLRVYMGNEVICTYSTNVVGDWSIRIVGGRFTTDIFKGEACIVHTGLPPSVQHIQTVGLDMDATDQLIRITHQNEISALAQVSLFSFLIRQLI